MFYSGSLQEGIALAVQQAKAVVCFVQDDSETSSAWEEYFTGDEVFTRLLEMKSVLLRITKDSPEAGFLASVCPVSKYPTTVVIRNGMLREYLVPEISKDDFHGRLAAALDDSKPQGTPPAPSSSVQSAPQSHDVEPSATPSPSPAVTTPVSALASNQSPVTKEQPSKTQTKSTSDGKKKVDQGAESKDLRETPVTESRGPDAAQKPVASASKVNPVKEAKERRSLATSPVGNSMSESSKSATASTPRSPSQYRLQVRLFDGRSVRSSFLPSQSIQRDVRSWLDGEMGEERRPYDLKHILTPLPNRNLTIADEGKTLKELIVGSTATFVMVPIPSYTDAYSGAVTSIPGRVISSGYSLVSSVVGAATGLVGSFLGYGQAAPSGPGPEPAPSTASTQPAGSNGARLRPFASSGPRIRTLRDQENERDRNQFYNGNQLNFEPRSDSDEQ